MSSVTSTETKAKGWWPRLQVFLGDVRSESKKVSWPTRDEVRDATIAVIVTSVLLAVFIFGVDQIMNFMVKAIL